MYKSSSIYYEALLFRQHLMHHDSAYRRNHLNLSTVLVTSIVQFILKTPSLLKRWISSEASILRLIAKDILNLPFKEMGHDTRVLTGFGRSMMGRGQIIQKIDNASGKLVWAAGSDPRGDGHASPQI